MRIMGIDPGMAIVGYCFLDCNCNLHAQNNDDYTLVNCGSIQTDKNLSNSERLLEIHNDLCELINTYKPDIAAVEKLFFFKNAKTIIPVVQAQGVILMTINKFNIPVQEYTPLEVKQSLTGYGRSEKSDVKEMVGLIMNNQNMPKLDDTVDAIAIAICHKMCNIA